MWVSLSIPRRLNFQNFLCNLVFIYNFRFLGKLSSGNAIYTRQNAKNPWAPRTTVEVNVADIFLLLVEYFWGWDDDLTKVFWKEGLRVFAEIFI